MGIHFGVDYYPEHWPRERWETDARLMKEMGLSVVRMAEFSWHKLEPQEGRYDFSWLDDAIAGKLRHTDDCRNAYGSAACLDGKPVS